MIARFKDALKCPLTFTSAFCEKKPHVNLGLGKRLKLKLVLLRLRWHDVSNYQ